MRDVNLQPNGGLPLQEKSPVDKGFAPYHGKRIALVLMYRNRATMFWGAAQYQEDELLGPALRIRLNRDKWPSETDVILSEKEWNGRIVPDTHYGCDFCFIPGQRSRGARSDRG